MDVHSRRQENVCSLGPSFFGQGLTHKCNAGNVGMRRLVGLGQAAVNTYYWTTAFVPDACDAVIRDTASDAAVVLRADRDRPLLLADRDTDFIKVYAVPIPSPGWAVAQGNQVTYHHTTRVGYLPRDFYSAEQVGLRNGIDPLSLT